MGEDLVSIAKEALEEIADDNNGQYRLVDLICLFFEYVSPGNPGDGSFYGLSHCLPFREAGRSIRPVMSK